MAELSLTELIGYDRLGWMMGPKEDVVHYLKRIERLRCALPTYGDKLAPASWQGAQRITEKLFGFYPKQMNAVYCKKHLSPLQGALTWVDSTKGWIELHPQLQKGPLLGIYRQDEILAHEALHLARIGFPLSRFEELLAYQTSTLSYRRWLAPLLHSPRALYLLCGATLLPLCISSRFPTIAPLIFFGYLGLLGLRLLFLHSTLWCARRQLRTLLPNPNDALAVLCRLADREIFTFAFAHRTRLQKHIQVQSTLRWRLIKARFFTSHID